MRTRDKLVQAVKLLTEVIIELSCSSPRALATDSEPNLEAERPRRRLTIVPPPEVFPEGSCLVKED
jgi:hypothetical protein